MGILRGVRLWLYSMPMDKSVRLGLGLAFAVVLGGTLFAGGYACSIAREMFLDPIATKALAAEALGEGWECTHSDIFCNTYHRYIFVRDGKRKDVNVRRDADGNWSAGATPILD